MQKRQHTCHPQKPYFAKGLCRACYMRAYRNGGILPASPAKQYSSTPICGHPNRKHRGLGLCGVCYAEQYRRSKGTQKRIKPINTCGHTERKHHVHGHCKECWLTSSRRKTMYKERMRDPVHRQQVVERQRKNKLRKLYGITPDDYAQLLQKQNGICAVCQKNKILKNRLAVDHNHTTGTVRGLLCPPCNRVIGYLENAEWAENAKKYLDEWSDK